MDGEESKNSLSLKAFLFSQVHTLFFLQLVDKLSSLQSLASST